MKVFNSITETIGRTPIMRLNRIEEMTGSNACLYGKLEAFNPAGSIKDRAALWMIKDAEAKGVLKAGATIIEPTSGNTGIGLAAVCAARGYKAIFVLPETMSIERQKLLRAYGAEVVLTPGKAGMQGSVDKANELAKEISGSFIPSQFDNPANPAAHVDTTGPEIWEDMDGKVDILVAGVGTGGTISGNGKFLKIKTQTLKLWPWSRRIHPFFPKGKLVPTTFRVLDPTSYRATLIEK